MLESFREEYEKEGVAAAKEEAPESQKYKKIRKNLEQISENSSERSSSVNSESVKKKFTLVLDLDETLVHYSEDEGEGKIFFRPHLDYFLREMSKNFELMIFTAAQQDYADTVINHLDPSGSLFAKRFYRQHTVMH